LEAGERDARAQEVVTEVDVATLADLRPGERGVIRGFRCTVPLMQRLLEMGLTRGTVVDVIRLAPLGDPMEFRLRGYYLSLRRAEARLIEIEPEARP
jgi:ferrous iron transport protein A